MWGATLVCLACLFASANCMAGCRKASFSKRVVRYSQIDSLMKNSIGDSISALIYRSKHVTAERINIKNDTLTVLKKRKLSAEECGVLRFLMASSEKYVGNAVVFGHFSPNVRFTFETRKAKCQLLMDFGLRQAIVRDAEDKDIAKISLKEEDFLKFANTLFPDDEYLTFLLKQYLS